MTDTMIPPLPASASPWFVAPAGLDEVAPSGRHRAPETDAEQEPAELPGRETDVPVDVAGLTPDPLADMQVGDSFLEVALGAAKCGELNMAEWAGDETYACARRPHPAHWQHIGVWAGRVRQIWAGSDGLNPVSRKQVFAAEVDAVLAAALGSPQPWPTVDEDGAR